jgi:ribosomal protein S16
VERLGTWDPVAKTKAFALEWSRLEYWTSKGALTSATVAKLLKKFPKAQTPAA